MTDLELNQLDAALEIKREALGLRVCFCVESVTTIASLNSVAFRGAFSLSRHGKTTVLPSNPTWVDLWKAADTLVDKNDGHIFLEAFYLEEGHISFYAGS